MCTSIRCTPSYHYTIDCARQCYKLIDVEEILRINSSTPKWISFEQYSYSADFVLFMQSGGRYATFHQISLPSHIRVELHQMNVWLRVIGNYV